MQDNTLKNARGSSPYNPLSTVLIAAGGIALGIELLFASQNFNGRAPFAHVALGFIANILKSFLSAVGDPDLQTRIVNVNRTPQEVMGARIGHIVLVLSIFVALPVGIGMKLLTKRRVSKNISG